jgi:hypothetical protein
MKNKIFAHFSPQPSNGLWSRALMALTLTLTVLFGLSFAVAANASTKTPSKNADPNAQAHFMAKLQGQSNSQTTRHASTAGHASIKSRVANPRHATVKHSAAKPAGKPHPNTGLNAEFIDFSYVPEYGYNFDNPVSVAVDNGGNVYVADEETGTIYEEMPQAGGGFNQVSVVTGFNCLSSIAVDYEGNIYAGDCFFGSAEVWFFPSGTQGAQAYSSGTPIDEYFCPSSIAVDSNLNVYVSDACNDFVGEEEFNGIGNSYTYNLVDDDLWEPYAVAVDSFFNVYIGDYEWGANPSFSYVIQLPNTGINTWGTAILLSDDFNQVSGLAVAPNGTIWVADDGYYYYNGEGYNDPAIYNLVPTNGYYYQIFVSNYNSYYPEGAALDSLGNFYVSDNDLSTIYEYSQNSGSVQVGNFNNDNNYVIANFLVFGTTNTVGAPAVYSQGETGADFYDYDDDCTGLAPSGDPDGYYCSVIVDFSPLAPGPRVGGVEIFDNLGNALASSPAFLGYGVAPRASYLPNGFDNTSAFSFIVNPATFAKPQVGGSKSLNTHLKQPKASTALYKGLELGTDLDTYLGDSAFGIAVDPDGNYFVSDPFGCSIWYSYDSGYDWYPLPLDGPVCPSGAITVDGSGNVIFSAYIESDYQGVLVDYNLGDGDYTGSTVVAYFTPTYLEPFYYITAVAVDAYDNVYITGSDDSYEDSYAFVAPAGSWYNNFTFFPDPYALNKIENQWTNEPFDWLTGIAADNYGDFFVSDYYLGQVYEFYAQSNGTYYQTEVARNLDTPSALNIDAAGDLYIVDSGDDTGISALYLAILGEGGPGPSSDYFLVPYVLSNYGSGEGAYFWDFAVDTNNNFYLTNAGYEGYAYITQLDVNDPPTVYFDETAIGVTSADSPEVAIFVNSGNDGLQIVAPSGSGTNPSISYNYLYNDDFYGFYPGGEFQVQNCPQLTSGSSNITFNPDTGCALPVSFLPQVAGTDDGTLVITSTTLYGTSYAPAAKGSTKARSSKAPASKLSLPHRSLATGSHGKLLKGVHPLDSGSVAQTVNLDGTGDMVTPTIQLLTSLNPAIPNQVVNFTITVTGPGAVPTGTVDLFYNTNILIGSGTINADGTILIPVSNLPVGTDTVYARYLGDSNYNPVTSNNISEVIQLGTPTILLLSSANPQTTLNPVTFSVSVTGSSLTPTGTITLYNGATSIANGPLVNGEAAFTLTSLPIGTDAITAAYSGDGNYATGTSAVLNEVITDFSVIITAPAATPVPIAKAGTPFQITFSVAPVAPATTIPSTVTLTATGAPLNTDYTLSQSTVAAGSGATSVTLTLNVPVDFIVKNEMTPNPTDHNKTKLPLAPLALALLLLPMAGKLRKAGKRMGRMAAMLLLAIAGISATATLIGCGSNTKVASDIVITATSGFDSHTTTLTIVVEGK